ncbi:MAG: hypothetical protein JW715_06360 [Sedimentisphaerales bacterium]|nr:hypothetical protein [Sedimentisphaerales bacterium]
MKRGKSLAKPEKTRGFLLLGFAFAFIVSSGPVALALDPLGPPTASQKPGQFLVGLEYSKSSTDLQLNSGKWIETYYSSINDSGEAISLSLSDFERTNTYVNIEYGADYNWDIFVRMASTEAEYGDSLRQQGESFVSDAGPMIGGGVRAIFLQESYIEIGGIAQVNWARYSGTLNSPLWDVPHFVETDLMEVQLAVGATYKWIEGIWVYGGPFIHFVSGEFTDTYVSEASTGGSLISEYTWDIEQDSMYGGYIGTQVELSRDCYLNLEYQMTPSASALGASFVLGF